MINKRKKNQENINVFKKTPQPKALPPPIKAVLDQSCMVMIAMDSKPFSTIENKGLRQVSKRLVRHYEPPTKTTLSRSLAPILYHEIKEKLINQLKEDIALDLMSMSFTSDCWTSRSRHSYIFLTLHYMTQNFELKNITLGMSQLLERHTGIYLKAELMRMLTKWDLLNTPTVPIYSVTDNGRNIPCNHSIWLESHLL